MSVRKFEVVRVTKPGQGNTPTKKPKQLFKGKSPSSAASKAITHVCSKMGKKIRGKCAMKIHVREVKESFKGGSRSVVPVKTATTGKSKTFAYRSQNPSCSKRVKFGSGKSATVVTFKRSPRLIAL